MRYLFTSLVLCACGSNTVVPTPEPTPAPIAPNVAEREPVGAGAEFDASVGAVYAWVQVKNLGEATTISMVWKKNGKTRLTVELPVGRSYGWKTWSKKGIGAKDVGAWTVEVLDGDGALVETLAFNVKAPSDVSAK